MKLNKVCKHPHCKNLTSNGAYCDIHRRALEKNKTRTAWYHLYANARWRRLSRLFLIRNQECMSCGSVANQVDHIRPHRGDLSLFWDSSNWQSLCQTCHSKKTYHENK